MVSTRLALIAAMGAIVLSPAHAQHPAGTAEGKVENRDGKGVYSVEGRVPNLPDGTFLHVSLSVQGSSPPIEAAFFRVVTDRNGSYSGTQEWPDGMTFPPMGYTTMVRLHMDAQAPHVKTFLQREFGYTSDHIQPIATVHTQVGTPEEQVAHRKATLVQLRDLCDQVEAFRRRLVEGMAKPGTDPAYTEFSASFGRELRPALKAYNAAKAVRIVWAEASLWERIGTSLRELFLLKDAHAEGSPDALRNLNSQGPQLERVRSEIESRLPSDLQRPRAE